jgi:hypothetical protein
MLTFNQAMNFCLKRKLVAVSLDSKHHNPDKIREIQSLADIQGGGKEFWTAGFISIKE